MRINVGKVKSFFTMFGMETKAKATRCAHHVSRLNTKSRCVPPVLVSLFPPGKEERIREECIRCSKCRSFTHARCISGNDGPFKCSTCRNADRLIFHPKEDKGSCKVMDMKAAHLLLTAAKFVKAWTSKAHDEAVMSALKQASKVISDKKRAVGAVERFMKFEECNDGPSLLDTSPEPSRETGLFS